MGRRKRDDDRERRIIPLRVKLTATERRAIDDAAEDRRVSVSHYVRELVLAKTAAALAMRHRNPEARLLVDELNRIGNNLNQIARQLNATGELRYPERLDAALQDYKSALGRVLAL